MDSGHGLCGQCWAQTTQAQVVPYVNLTCKLLRGLLVPVNGLRGGGEDGVGFSNIRSSESLQASDDEHFIFCSSFFFFWGFLLLNAHKISAKLNYKYGKKSLRDRKREREGERDHYDSWQRLGTSFLPVPPSPLCHCWISGISAYKVRVKFKSKLFNPLVSCWADSAVSCYAR